MLNHTVEKILVFSRMIVEEAIDSEEPLPFLGRSSEWALISIYSDLELISTPRRIEALKKLGCKDYLSIIFNDIEQEKEDWIIFTEDHAKEIIKFIDKIKDQAKILVVHCTAGISRSGAVGLFACRYLKLKESLFWLQNSRVMPNNHVLNILGTVAGIDIKYQEDNSDYQSKYKKFKSIFNEWK